MPELRWILLGAGVALIFGLWWWETRRPRPAERDGELESWDGQRAAAPSIADSPAEGDEYEQADSQIPPAYAPTIERARIERRPPLIEIPEDMEVDVSEFVGIDRRHSPQHEFSLAAESGGEDGHAEVVAEVEYVEEQVEEEHDDHHRAPWVSTQPLERDLVAPPREEEPPEMPLNAVERRTGKPRSSASWRCGSWPPASSGPAKNCAPRSRQRASNSARTRSFIGPGKTASRCCTSQA